jgi:hypothetical protein
VLWTLLYMSECFIARLHMSHLLSSFGCKARHACESACLDGAASGTRTWGTPSHPHRNPQLLQGFIGIIQGAESGQGVQPRAIERASQRTPL